MVELNQANEHLVAFDSTLEVLDDQGLPANGTVANYAAILVPRVRSAYSSMSLLLLNGRHDEMVLVLRRQLEDSMRLHYLVANEDRAEQLVLAHRRVREVKVLRQLDRSINDQSVVESARSALRDMASVRRRRVRDLDAIIEGIDATLEEFPDFAAMASALNRSVDLVPYASASEVSHSAISAATDGYVGTDQRDGRAVGIVSLTSENVVDRLGYARVAINTTGMAIMHGLTLLGMNSEASVIALDASERVEALASLLASHDNTE